MVIYEISIVLLFEFPYGISEIYSISTSYLTKLISRQTQEQFMNVFLFIYAYIVNGVKL